VYLTLEEMAVAESQEIGALLISIERVAHLISLCTIYEILYLYGKESRKATKELESALVALYTVILRFLAEATQFYKNHHTGVLQGTFPNLVDSFVNKCGYLENRVSTEAENCEGTSNRTAHLMLGEYGYGEEGDNSQVAALSDRLDENKRLKILLWVSNIPYKDSHFIAREGRVDGTGEWLFTHQRYVEWRRSSSSAILWLHGAGKCLAYI
jgi:hypothetical protein